MAKKMTVKQICDELGYDVEVITELPQYIDIGETDDIRVVHRKCCNGELDDVYPIGIKVFGDYTVKEPWNNLEEPFAILSVEETRELIKVLETMIKRVEQETDYEY